MFDWSNKVVLVTGGTGSLGQALVLELTKGERIAKKVIVFSRREFLQSEMAKWAGPNARFFIGDVRDYERLRRAFDSVDVVIHAAALKRIESCSYNIEEAIRTNVDGSLNVMKAAVDCLVGRMMAVSSDKASAALTTYGITKALMERIFTDGNNYVGYGRPTAMACVRYGNVFGSRGSFIHTWKECQARGEPIPITHEAMTRFIITLDQAVDFVLSSVEMMRGGEVFIPKLPSVRMVRIAEALAGEGSWRIIGERGSEKLHEEMISHDEGRRGVSLFGDRFIFKADGGAGMGGYDSSGDTMTDDALRALLADR